MKLKIYLLLVLSLSSFNIVSQHIHKKNWCFNKKAAAPIAAALMAIKKDNIIKFNNSLKSIYPIDQLIETRIQAAKYGNESFEIELNPFCTLVEFAAYLNRSTIARTLLSDYRVNPNFLNSDPLRNSALIYAAYHGNIKLVTELIKFNADIDYQNENQGTALMVAAKFGRNEIVEFLINKNANLLLKDKDGNDALLHALASCKLSTIIILISNLKKLNVKICEIANKDGDNILIKAAQNQCSSITKLLLDLDFCNVDYTNKSNVTALMMATAAKQTEIIDLLIEHNASIDIKSIFGDTAIDIAINIDEPEIADFLQEHLDNT